MVSQLSEWTDKHVKYRTLMKLEQQTTYRRPVVTLAAHPNQ